MCQMTRWFWELWTAVLFTQVICFEQYPERFWEIPGLMSAEQREVSAPLSVTRYRQYRFLRSGTAMKTELP